MSEDLILIDIKAEAKSIITDWFNRIETAEGRAKLRAAINAYSGHIEKSFKANVVKVVKQKNETFVELKKQFDSGFPYSVADCDDMIKDLEEGEEKEAWMMLRDYIDMKE